MAPIFKLFLYFKFYKRNIFSFIFISGRYEVRAWEYMYVCMYVNDDNERRQRKSSQRAVGREVAEKRERERRKNESKVKEKVKENQIV